MVGEDGWRVGKADEAWIRIKAAEGWPGTTHGPQSALGTTNQNIDTL